LSDFNITIFCQAKIPGINIKSIHKQLHCNTIELKTFSLQREKIAWQNLPIKFLLYNFDTYVFSGNPRIISTLLWASLFRLFGKRVILWGQARTANSKKSTEIVRLFWWKWFKFILVYTDDEVKYLHNLGFHNKLVIGLNNGLDQNSIEKAAKNWRGERLNKWIEKQELSEKLVLLSCARLESKNKFHLMIKVLEPLSKRFPNILWCVIGQGIETISLKKQAEKIGVSKYIRWLGSIYEEDKLTPWFLVSKVLIHPGAIGLTLFHAFGYSLPVITHGDLFKQMPEATALIDNENGLIYKENDIESLCKKITEIISDDLKRMKLSTNALKIVQKDYNIDEMVKRFVSVL